MTHCVVLFPTITAALMAEKRLLQTGWPIQLIPTPRRLSSDCGVALRVESRHREAVRQILEQARLEGEIRDLPWADA